MKQWQIFYNAILPAGSKRTCPGYVSWVDAVDRDEALLKLENKLKQLPHLFPAGYKVSLIKNYGDNKTIPHPRKKDIDVDMDNEDWAPDL